MRVLEVENLVVGYGKTVVINGVSFSVEEGAATGLIGPNGSGKTTLVRSILGYIKPWSGKVTYRGVDITGMPAHKIARMGVGYVPERGGILRSLTVGENIDLAVSMSKHGRDRVREVKKLFKIIEERRDQIAGTLSGGEQRMLSIALAILMTDKLIVLDEPSAGLAPAIRKRLAQTLRQIKEELGISILLTEQDPTLVLEVANVVHVLEMGSIVRSGDAREIIRFDTLREHYLGM